MADQIALPRPAGPLPAPATWLQIAMLLCLVGGSLGHTPAALQLAALLALAWMATQVQRMIRLAQVFLALAAVLAAVALAVMPGAFARIETAVIQGTGFAALMMVLGLLRDPVRRSRAAIGATGYLLSVPPARRFAALFAGAHLMSLMFNVGIIAMIGDLTESRDGRDLSRDPSRRAMVMAAMRGAALVAIWSPIGLGFAIVSAGIPTLDPVRLVLAAAAFTAVAVLIGCRWPLLPPEASVQPEDRPAPPVSPMGPMGPMMAPGIGPMLAILAISGLLLAATYALHRLAGPSFTVASVSVLPAFALVWLALESRGAPGRFGPRLGLALTALGDLRSEGATFLSANVIGAVLSMGLQATPVWHALVASDAAGLPLALACLVAVPLAASVYLPNTIVVVMGAQLLGHTPLGTGHPLTLALALCIGWGLAICVSPLSAMCLITARFCGVSSRKVALGWNARYVFLLTLLGLAAVTLCHAAGL
ncbi:hypothetical protein V8J36_02765 [Frigidibacter sp. MR17.14]|uniref:hypothetical protein n=1 Tax=Frigidibacter sp. MR17.14 TaxID=3126509 RepID=UPI003012C9EC